MRKKIALLLLFIIITCAFVLTGCQSTDKSEAYLKTGLFSNAVVEYNELKDMTQVTWQTELTNDTIYDIEGFHITLLLYRNSEVIAEENFTYNQKVAHGGAYFGTFSFEYEGMIDSIEYVSWRAEYASFWDTYKVWFIVMFVIIGVVLLVYIAAMIMVGFDFTDVIDWLGEHGWIFFSLLAPVAYSIWGIATSNWVPLLIVFGGLVVIIVILLLAHLIQWFIEYFCCYGFGSSGGNEDYLDINDCINDEESLYSFTVNDLKEYCRDNGITGYSSLNKADLVDLIMSKNTVETNNEEIKKSGTKRKNINTGHKQPISKTTFDDIAGLDEAKNAFKEKVVLAFEHKKLYEKYGKKVGGGILLYGLPGTGKTMFAEAAANATDALFIPVKCSDIKSKWYGESEEKVKKIFDKARKAKNAIIFFDEFEAIGAKRTDNSENGNNDLVPQILAEMQGVGASNNDSVIVVIAATNKPWSIDSAFLRPGRFDDKIYVPLPDFEARKKLFELKLSDIPQDNIDYDYLAKETDGFNGADIGAYCDKLKMLAINKSIQTNAECPITMAEVEQVNHTIKSSVSQEDIDQLLEFEQYYR